MESLSDTLDKLGLKRCAVADSIGIKTQRFNLICNGKAKISDVDEAEKLATFLNARGADCTAIGLMKKTKEMMNEQAQTDTVQK